MPMSDRDSTHKNHITRGFERNCRTIQGGGGSLERLRYQNAFDFQLYKIEEVVFYVSIKIKDLRIPKVYDFDTKSL